MKKLFVVLSLLPLFILNPPARAATDEASWAFTAAFSMRCLRYAAKLDMWNVQHSNEFVVYAGEGFDPRYEIDTIYKNVWKGVGKEYAGTFRRLGIRLVTIKFTWDWTTYGKDDPEQAFQGLKITLYSPDRLSLFEMHKTKDGQLNGGNTTFKRDQRELLATKGAFSCLPYLSISNFQ